MTSQRKASLSKSNGRWTTEEHLLFIQGLTKYGKDWKKIEEILKSRDGAQIRSHAQKFFLRMTKEYKRILGGPNRMRTMSEGQVSLGRSGLGEEEEDFGLFKGRNIEAWKEKSEEKTSFLEEKGGFMKDNQKLKGEFIEQKGCFIEEKNCFIEEKGSLIKETRGSEETNQPFRLKEKEGCSNIEGFENTMLKELSRNPRMLELFLPDNNSSILNESPNLKEEEEEEPNPQLEKLENLEKIKKGFELAILNLSLYNPIQTPSHATHKSFYEYMNIGNKKRKLSDLIEYSSDENTKPSSLQKANLSFRPFKKEGVVDEKEPMPRKKMLFELKDQK